MIVRAHLHIFQCDVRNFLHLRNGEAFTLYCLLQRRLKRLENEDCRSVASKGETLNSTHLHGRHSIRKLSPRILLS